MENLKISDDYETYKLGSFKLKSGGEIPDAFIAYKTFGDSSLPAIIYPSWYSGSRCLLAPYSMTRALTDISQRHIRQSLADRLGQDTQPIGILHHHHRAFWQRPVLVPIEYYRLAALP
jgi:hypothetical protein